MQILSKLYFPFLLSNWALTAQIFPIPCRFRNQLCLLFDFLHLLLLEIFLSLSSSVSLHLFHRVTCLPTRRGERASCRGRDKNTSASSSNTMTPATTNTIKTHTDRYVHIQAHTHTHKHKHIPCTVHMCVLSFLQHLTFHFNKHLSESKSSKDRMIDGFNFHYNFLSLLCFLSTDLGHKALYVYVCMCFDRIGPERITRTRTRNYVFFPHVLFFLSLVYSLDFCLSVCLSVCLSWMKYVHGLFTESPQPASSFRELLKWALILCFENSICVYSLSLPLSTSLSLPLSLSHSPTYSFSFLTLDYFLFISGR